MRVGLRGLGSAALLGVLACATTVGAGGPSGPSAGAAQGSPDLLYVCNQDAATVSIIDATSLRVLETLDLRTLGFPSNAKPHHVQVEPDGSYWYLSLIGANTVVKLDRRNAVVARAEFEVPGMLALDPLSDRLYVGRSMSAVNPPQRIGIITRSTMAIDEIDVFIARPHALTVSRDGRYVYSGSLAENRIAALAVDRDETTLTEIAGHHHHMLMQFAVAPDGRHMVASGEMSGELLVFDLDQSGAPAVRHTVSVNAAPWDPVYTRDGRYVVLGNQRTNTITVVDANTWRVAKVLQHPAIAEPWGSVASADGRYVFVSNQNARGSYTTPSGEQVGNVVAIDIQSWSIAAVIPVGKGATGIGTRQTR